MAVDFSLADFAGLNQGADATLGEAGANAAHAGTDGRGANAVMAAVVQVVGHASHLNGEADGCCRGCLDGGVVDGGGGSLMEFSLCFVSLFSFLEMISVSRNHFGF